MCCTELKRNSYRKLHTPILQILSHSLKPGVSHVRSNLSTSTTTLPGRQTSAHPVNEDNGDISKHSELVTVIYTGLEVQNIPENSIRLSKFPGYTIFIQHYASLFDCSQSILYLVSTILKSVVHTFPGKDNIIVRYLQQNTGSPT